MVDTGELKTGTWTEYHATCERLVTTFGKERLVTDLASEDFEALRASIAKQWGAVRLGNEVQRVRMVFKYGYDAGMIDKPVRFGPAFRRPSLKTLRKARADKGPRMFEAADIRAMLDTSEGQLRAMILLGINAGYGNEDIATLKISALDLDGEWAKHPRPKTGVERKAKLWPETINALREVLANRKPPTNERHAELVFITKYGKSWNGKYGSAITHEMDKLLRRLQLKRPGRSFYTLRHVFETEAGESRDQVAVNSIMGHVDTSMAGHYRERISDERLQVVAEFVRTWLFADAEKGKPAQRLKITEHEDDDKVGSA